MTASTRTRDPDADAWITEMERLRDECVELVQARFLLVIQSLDTGEPAGEVAAVMFVADDENVGLRHALMNLLVVTDADLRGNAADVSFSYSRGHRIDVAFAAADAGQIRDVAEALA